MEVLPAAAAVTGSGSQGGVFIGEPYLSETLTAIACLPWIRTEPSECSDMLCRWQWLVYSLRFVSVQHMQ